MKVSLISTELTADPVPAALSGSVLPGAVPDDRPDNGLDTGRPIASGLAGKGSTTKPTPTKHDELFTPAVGRTLAQALLETRAERDRYRQLYTETLAALTTEQQAHRRTRKNLLQALRDVLP